MSFSFGSDDDAFLAAVDLGADLGRPIDFDEGMEGGSLADEPWPPLVNEPSSRASISGHTTATNTKLSGSTSTENSNAAGLKPQAPQIQTRPTNSSGSVQVQNTVASRGPALQQPSDRLSANQPPNRLNVNQPPNRLIPSAQPLANKRPSAPSAGGFHFPPGVVRQVLDIPASTNNFARTPNHNRRDLLLGPRTHHPQLDLSGPRILCSTSFINHVIFFSFWGSTFM
ncbi:hypothetical protein BD779DRAFT_321941 [Infundibulicybe gibba]|nr:hypothetical protein BD779DRAFT_321941 [Infundibulicybe gibba]